MSHFFGISQSQSSPNQFFDGKLSIFGPIISMIFAAIGSAQIAFVSSIILLLCSAGRSKYKYLDSRLADSYAHEIFNSFFLWTGLILNFLLILLLSHSFFFTEEYFDQSYFWSATFPVIGLCFLIYVHHDLPRLICLVVISILAVDLGLLGVEPIRDYLTQAAS